MQGPEHFSMWKSRQGRPWAFCRSKSESEQVRTGKVRSNWSSVFRIE